MMKMKPMKQIRPLWSKQERLQKSVAATKVANILRRPEAVVKAEVVVDPQQWSPRVRSRICSMLLQGFISGGGISGKWAAILDNEFKLGCAAANWGRSITITPDIRKQPELIQKLKEVCQTEAVTSLLSSKTGGEKWKTHVESLLKQNLAVLNGENTELIRYHYHRADVMFMDTSALERAGALVGELRTAEYTERTKELVEKIRNGAMLRISMDNSGLLEIV